jgi:hypothetical protein
MKKQLIILSIILATLNAYAQHDHQAHAAPSQEQGKPSFADEKVGVSYEHYLHLKNALVASNPAEAKNAAAELQKTLSAIPGGKEAAAEAATISASSNIAEQRKSFASLSTAMTGIIKASKLSAGSLYVAYCPMANDHEGAYWLSNEKEIKNPYFGDRMLRCGSVKETLQ